MFKNIKLIIFNNTILLFLIINTHSYSGNILFSKDSTSIKFISGAPYESYTDSIEYNSLGQIENIKTIAYDSNSNVKSKMTWTLRHDANSGVKQVNITKNLIENNIQRFTMYEIQSYMSDCEFINFFISQTPSRINSFTPFYNLIVYQKNILNSDWLPQIRINNSTSQDSSITLIETYNPGDSTWIKQFKYVNIWKAGYLTILRLKGDTSGNSWINERMYCQEYDVHSQMFADTLYEWDIINNKWSLFYTVKYNLKYDGNNNLTESNGSKHPSTLTIDEIHLNVYDSSIQKVYTYDSADSHIVSRYYTYNVNSLKINNPIHPKSSSTNHCTQTILYYPNNSIFKNAFDLSGRKLNGTNNSELPFSSLIYVIKNVTTQK